MRDELCPRPAKPPTQVPYFFGTLNLTVVSTGDVGVSLRYVQTGDGTDNALPGTSANVSLLSPHLAARSVVRGITKPTEAIPLHKGQPEVLILRFALPAVKPPSDLDGTLMLSHSGLAIPLTAKLEPLGSIRVEPSKLVLSVGSTQDDSASVDLVGPGVPGLISHRGTSPPQVRLGDGRDAPVAILRLPSDATGDDPDRVVASVQLKTVPKPGKYSGDLLISDTAPAAPHVSLEVHSHWSEWIALLLLAIALV
jgi:hypothetical protein